MGRFQGTMGGTFQFGELLSLFEGHSPGGAEWYLRFRWRLGARESIEAAKEQRDNNKTE